MSNPNAPYYYKIGEDEYHWERSCSSNYYPNDGWKKTNSKPSNREQCNQCRGK